MPKNLAVVTNIPTSTTSRKLRLNPYGDTCHPSMRVHTKTIKKYLEIYTVLHMFGQVLFLAGNHDNHKDRVPCMLP